MRPPPGAGDQQGVARVVTAAQVIDDRQDDGQDDALLDADDDDDRRGDRGDDELVAAHVEDPAHAHEIDQLDADEEHDRRRAPPRACTASGLVRNSSTTSTIPAVVSCATWLRPPALSTICVLVGLPLTTNVPDRPAETFATPRPDEVDVLVEALRVARRVGA